MSTKRRHSTHIQPLAGGHDVIGRSLLLSLLAVLATYSTPTAGAQTAGRVAVPKIVVNILVDQLRSDYLEAFMPLYGEGGFKRLLGGGRVYSQAEYPMMRPDAASAAATVATGAAPSSHGVVGTYWIDRQTLRTVFCADDNRYAGLGGTFERLSPASLQVSTIGDELKVATEGKALVYALAPNAEVAIFSAGHAADAALWIDDEAGAWCTTSFYGGMPAWASVRNQYAPLADYLKNNVWKPSSDLVGNFSYFLSGGMKEPFAHRFKGEGQYAAFKTSGLVNAELAAAARACVDGTALASDAITDYLSVTFYAGNYEHRPLNESSLELQDTYVRLDRAVADLIDAVEHKAGQGNALYVLTSTGYADVENTDLSAYRIPTGTFDVRRASTLLNMYLSAVYGQGKYIEACLGTQFYLNHKLVEEKQLYLTEVLERSQDFLMQLSGVKDVYTSQRLSAGAWTPGISRIRAGYNARVSGDIMIEVAPGWHYINEDTHENQLVRASFISYPIIFYGYGVAPSKEETPVTVDCIAPTLSKALRIRAPNACASAPLY